MTKSAYVYPYISKETKYVDNVLKLLSEGATIPFISRYRKEMSGGMDETEVEAVKKHGDKYDEISSRKDTILKAIEEQGKMNAEIRESIETCWDAQQLEDIYLPYKKKKQTRGEKAKAKGLEGLARIIYKQHENNVENRARDFLNSEVKTTKEAIEGAKDIIAEWINENTFLRQRLRDQLLNYGRIASSVIKTKKVKTTESEKSTMLAEGADKYKDYFDWEEAVSKVPSHRYLAMIRGEKEGFLKVKIIGNQEKIIEIIRRTVVKGSALSSMIVEEICEDAWKRLIQPSLENDIKGILKEKSDEGAIEVFSKNLKQLLLASPLGNKRILAIDPGFRTGCKVVCLDETGRLLTNVTIYPHPPQKESSKAASKVSQLVETYKIEAIAIGDGTASRETESFVKKITFRSDVLVFVVREDGASIYSASPIARKEFPDYDVTVRGAVSIGRRLMDPLSELVKIDPKSIGVGQYQHDVDQKKLKESLDAVVISAVNSVGVDVNTASPYLLEYVSGLGPQLAQNIIQYRKENKGIKSRKELKKVARMGDKAYEQCAGFLRIRDGENPLDNSSVHPESYKIVQAIAKSKNVNVEDFIGNEELIDSIHPSEFQQFGGFTVVDILNELKKPGRDPRNKVKVLEFSRDIKTIEDLQVGMKIPGIVTNVTNFGAFVNIGIKENGLIHKSQIADEYVEDPAEYLSLDQHLEVKIVSLDLERKRIGLTLKK
ncbi:MAG: Tex family protein [Crocinitomicaceae bacterium]